MSYGMLCLVCRHYLRDCECDWPIPSNDGVTPVETKAKRQAEEVRDVWLQNRGADGSDWESALMAVYKLAVADAHARTGEPAWQCAARRGNTGAGTPQDCDWPFCGCDEHATRVIEAALNELLSEAGRRRFTARRKADAVQPPPEPEPQAAGGRGQGGNGEVGG